jgi:adenylate cyclase
MSLMVELKRRNVFRVAAAYVVAAWLVVQVVETVLPAFGFGDSAIRLSVIFLAIGFLPALVFSWVFELTPDGIKKESDIDRDASTTPQTGKRLDQVILVVLAAAVLFFAFDKFILSESREVSIAEQARQEGRTEALVQSYGDKSIAVLPFADMSPNGDQEYFSDGISEELLNLLAKIPELRVISRSSAFSFKGKDATIGEIAAVLNVAHVLEGSVRKAGNQIRITTQLIEARSDTHLWSETYDRTLDNIFAVQDEIAAVVVERLKLELLGTVPTALTTDPDSYATFLRARSLRRQNSSDSLDQAQALLEQVLAVDPNYLPAIDDLASVYMNQIGTGALSYQDAYELARALTLKGLEIDPNYARFYVQLGWIKLFHDHDMAAAAELYERALVLDGTNTTSLGDTASVLLYLGRVDESIRLSEFVNQRDPFHPITWANYGLVLLAADRFDDAVSAFRRALELSPGYGWGHYMLSVALLLAGDPALALIEAQKESSEAPGLTGLAIANHALGNKDASDDALQLLVNDFSDDAIGNIAQIYAFRGENDAAFEWLAKMVQQNHPELMDLNGSPLYMNLHSDPRWTELLISVGRSPEDLAAISFEMNLPDGN